MEWCYPATTNDKRELRKHRYASKNLWGIDFELRAAKTSRALMLVAGDGHTNIFGPDVSSLNPQTWYGTYSGQLLMQKLKEAKLISQKVKREDEARLLKDEDLAWEYFDELKFDVILTNPPFAGERKDRKELSHYELAKPALKRAKGKQPKEERDVLFIERVIKFLKPGGRAAIVLPQGKFNNSSLAFIREWILRKARLIAVVGLHQNTFKPHTGTKTSVLFIQKYRKDELKKIEKVKQSVARNCPDYEAQIKKLINKFKTEIDIPEENIPEDIMELLLEAFGEVEPEVIEEAETDSNGPEVEEVPELEDLIEHAEENIRLLRNDLLKAKQKLEDFDSDLEALKEKAQQEMDVISAGWTGTKKALNAELKPIKDKLKADTKALKQEQKDKKKKVKAEIKSLEKTIPEAKENLQKITNKGKLELVLTDEELIGILKERWIDTEVAKKLDYPIFMAVSERGGKNNSGDYEYIIDEDGNLLEDKNGQPVIDQDLVNYQLSPEDLANVEKLTGGKLCVAEAFVRFAKKYDLNFWRVD